MVSGDWISGRNGVNGFTRSRKRRPDMVAVSGDEEEEEKEELKLCSSRCGHEGQFINNTELEDRWTHL